MIRAATRWTALGVGFCQILAMIPGVSRAGATIMGALMLGVSRPAATEFSFFLAIPTMFGASAYDLYKSRGELSFDNGEVIVTCTDGSTARLALHNPANWWPIEQDYFIDDFQFRRPEPVPPRVNLKTGEVRILDVREFKGRGGVVPGGAATVLELALDPAKELQSLTVRALANEVVVGLMAATLER